MAKENNKCPDCGFTIIAGVRSLTPNRCTGDYTIVWETIWECCKCQRFMGDRKKSRAHRHITPSQSRTLEFWKKYKGDTGNHILESIGIVMTDCGLMELKAVYYYKGKQRLLLDESIHLLVGRKGKYIMHYRNSTDVIELHKKWRKERSKKSKEKAKRR